jgi:hypothetical protein
VSHATPTNLKARLKRRAALYYGVSSLRGGIKIKWPASGQSHWASGDFESVWSLLRLGRKLAKAHRAHLATVTDTVMFIGNQRTGHSLVGSLLDAHPNAMIAHEVNALKLHAIRFPRRYIDALLYENSRAFAEEGRGESGYDYEVAGQYQGRHTELRVLGDKDARRDTTILGRFPRVLDTWMRRNHGRRLRVLQVVRNPFDTISTIWARPFETWVERDQPPPIEMIDRYFELCDATLGVRERLPVLTLRHEELVAHPGEEIERTCRFLDLPCPEDYRRACAAIVRPATHRSRERVPWGQRHVDRVSSHLDRFPFMDGYAFESD